MKKKVMLFGMGEVGNALRNVFEEDSNFHLVGRDIRPELCFGEDVPGPLDVLHINIPWSDKFIDMVVGLIWDEQPRVTIINSTIPIGTTRQIIGRVGYRVVHSPVRGMHGRDVPFGNYMLKFKRYIGAVDKKSSEDAFHHLKEVGFKVIQAGPPELTELAKIQNLSYYALLITWAKQVNDICDKYGLNYYDVMEFSKELRSIYTPGTDYEERGIRPILDPEKGTIGGHCIIPGCEHLLRTESPSLIEAVLDDNRERTQADKVKRK